MERMGGHGFSVQLSDTTTRVRAQMSKIQWQITEAHTFDFVNGRHCDWVCITCIVTIYVLGLRL
jgi:hypothetical protein